MKNKITRTLTAFCAALLLKVPLQKLIFLGPQTGPAGKSLSRENF